MRFIRSQLCAAVVGAAVLQFLGCQDMAEPAPEDDTNALALSRGHAPREGVALGAPLFGLDAAPDGSLLAAVASAGVVAIRGQMTKTIAELPGVSDVVAIGRGEVYATTGGSEDPAQIFPTSMKLFRVSHGRTREVADLFAFEREVNPDGFWHTGPTSVQSNPFDVALLHGGRVLVADAAANDILLVKANGEVDWVAVLTPITPGGPEPVATSIAVGPNGDYYAGELTGFPGTPGLSRIWRIKRGSRHVICPSVACTLVAGGFTSIMDLAFGPDGTLYVVEFDEAGWLAVEGNGFRATPAGGTVNACNVRTGLCWVVATGLKLPTAVTIDRSGTVWVSEHEEMLFAGARVRPLCESGRSPGYKHRGWQRLPSCRHKTMH